MSSNTIKGLLVFLAIVAAVFFLLDRSMARGLQELLKQSDFRFSRLYQGNSKADVLVLGNSRAVNAFYAPEMEKVLGKEVFQLSYNGMSMEVAELLFRDYLEHNEAPDLLLLEITNLHVTNELLKDLKLYYGMSRRLRNSMAEETPILKMACDLTHLYRFNGELFLRTLFYFKKSDQSWINSGRIDPDFAASYEIPQSEKAVNLFPVNGSNWQSLLAMIEECKKEHISIVLVVSPYLPAHRLGLEEYQSNLEAMKSVLPEGIILIDGSLALKDHQDFADAIHINKDGGEEFLKYLMPGINKAINQ